eukprot:TRINITY_DN2297_c0_g2_i2.p1 TRINITY_DN2297_c0_g2~~TRINITY_DN2297_c0_g2_i2.p1  ORF type:complete len:616 (+),score=185.02 TRINITY_DN2297_c0_g2_i2:76-1923(+)
MSVFHCLDCRMTLNSEDQCRAHLEGLRHHNQICMLERRAASAGVEFKMQGILEIKEGEPIPQGPKPRKPRGRRVKTLKEREVGAADEGAADEPPSPIKSVAGSGSSAEAPEESSPKPAPPQPKVRKQNSTTALPLPTPKSLKRSSKAKEAASAEPAADAHDGGIGCASPTPVRQTGPAGRRHLPMPMGGRYPWVPPMVMADPNHQHMLAHMEACMHASQMGMQHPPQDHLCMPVPQPYQDVPSDFFKRRGSDAQITPFEYSRAASGDIGFGAAASDHHCHSHRMPSEAADDDHHSHSHARALGAGSIAHHGHSHGGNTYSHNAYGGHVSPMCGHSDDASSMTASAAGTCGHWNHSHDDHEHKHRCSAKTEDAPERKVHTCNHKTLECPKALCQLRRLVHEMHCGCGGAEASQELVEVLQYPNGGYYLAEAMVDALHCCGKELVASLVRLFQIFHEECKTDVQKEGLKSTISELRERMMSHMDCTEEHEADDDDLDAVHLEAIEERQAREVYRSSACSELCIQLVAHEYTSVDLLTGLLHKALLGDGHIVPLNVLNPSDRRLDVACSLCAALLEMDVAVEAQFCTIMTRAQPNCTSRAVSRRVKALLQSLAAPAAE